MLFAKNITTFILVLLLANPACCCALIGCGASDETPTPVSSCCSEPADSKSDDDAPSDEHDCSCSINKQYTEQGQFSFSGPDFPLLTDPPVVFVDVAPIAPIFTKDSPLAKRPPPGPALRVLYSVFRL